MAKLKGPLFSLGASQQLGKALVFFPWKGLNVVREYVVPANPKSAGQLTQRGYLTDAVTAIHTAQGHATFPLKADDVTAYALWASAVQAATTWFNQVCRNWLDQRVAGIRSAIYRYGTFTPEAGQVHCQLYFTEDGTNTITAGDWWYGTSKTALVNSHAATIVADLADDTITGLTTGVKYYFQFRPTAHADFVGSRSGIYHATPT